MQKIIYSFCIMALSLAACQEATEQTAADTAIPVMTETVHLTNAGNNLRISGNVEGASTVKLGFLVGGRINYMAGEEGDYLSKGQLAASLDPADYLVAREMADVQVKKAADQYDRVTIMHNRNSVSESDFKQAGFALEQAQAQQKQQAQNLAHTRLTSPINGIILRKVSSVGEITGTGNPVLVIADISQVKVNAYIPENELQHVRQGQAAQVHIAALDTTYTGRISEAGAAADPGSRAFTVRIELPNPGQRIRPGMIAEVQLDAGKDRDALTVPAEAILKDADGQAYVYVADRQEQKAFKRKVSLGPLIDNRLIITAGLNDGELIVTGGQQKLSDGSPIRFTQL